MRPPVFFDPDNLPGIVLHQPYAGLVRLAALGLDGKPIETRKTRIHYRGPLVIVAGLDTDDVLVNVAVARAIARGLPHPAVMECLGLEGVAVALFDVADCRPLLPSDEPRSWFFAEGRHAWMPSRIRPLRPFPVRGAQGFLRVPRAQVLAAIEGPGAIFCPGCGKRHPLDDGLTSDGLFTCACKRSWRVGPGPAQAPLFPEAP
jgi:hypothetical protein